MDDVIEVENYIDGQWMRHVHLLSNDENAEINLPVYASPVITKEAGVWHVRASWAAREAFAGTLRGDDRIERQIVLWAFSGQRVSVCIRDAAREFWKVFGRQPDFAAVHAYPDAMGLDVDVEIDGGAVALVECADVPRQFVMVF
jgi:hypothetical protein